MSYIIGDLYQYIWTWLPTNHVETVIIKEVIKEVEKEVIKEVEKVDLGAGRNFVGVACLSGSLAVIMAAYGAHAFKSDTEDGKGLLKVFESGNKMHLIHSVVLLGVPHTRKPVLVGTLLTAGLLLFSGSCYYQAITHDSRIRKITPYGGVLLILAWLAMI